MHKGTLTIFSTLLVAGTFTVARADDKDPIGPIDSLGDVQDSAKMLFKMADVNNDGLISQKEAVDAGNLLVGGFFFRADANGDGKVTKEEGDQARENLLNQRPILRFVLQRAEQETAAQGSKPEIDKAGKNAMAAIDTNQDGSLDATELRQAVQTGVQSLFLTADRNGDSQLDPAELNGAAVELGRAGLQAAFQTADLDNNGAVSRDEFEKAIVNPASVVFRVMDANNDGQLSREELQSGVRVIVGELKNLQVPEPANSITNQVKQAVERTPAPAPAAAPATTVQPR
ncbi:EF-hand domain-containing protein [Paludisphaera soli]|uniref:EF-hand domain-containing protein n=1 Tax=Paludisphaera soli TaxID=2712865 RepID=UPI0013ED86B1|nr:EF-hand domain-containing protein [Paludisphaera soli]